MKMRTAKHVGCTREAIGPVTMIAYWGPEIRLMVFSGLIDRLTSEREVVLLSRVTDGDFVNHLPKGCRLEPLVLDRIPRTLARLTALANTAHGRRMDRIGMRRGLEGNVGLRPKQSGGQVLRRLLARLFQFDGAVRIMSDLEGYLRSKWAAGPGPLQERLREMKPSAFLSMDTVHPSAALAAEVVGSLGGRTALFAGNWKDIGRGLRESGCWDYYLVWNRAMSESLLMQNPHLRSERIREVGTPQFDLHHRASELEPREMFMRQLGFDPDRRLLCFTAAAERVVPEEAKTVRSLCQAISDSKIKGAPVLLVRLNPTGSDPNYQELPSEFPFVRVVDARWDHRSDYPGGRWQASERDDISFFLNTIQHSAMNISAASTVTLDFAVLDRPVVTVAFDPPGARVRGRSVATFHFQDDYRPAVELGACRVVGSETDLCREVNAYLQNPRRDSEERQAFVAYTIGPYSGKSVEMIARVLLAEA